MNAIREKLTSLIGLGTGVKVVRSNWPKVKWSDFANPIFWTPLMSAAFHGSVSTVKLLLDLGCPAEYATSGAHSALMVAALCGHDALVQILANRAALSEGMSGMLGYTTLHFACSSCAVETVRALMKLGANPNTVSLLGATPLNVAQTSGRIDIAKYLDSLGALEGDPEADAKFNIMRSAILPNSYVRVRNVVHLMSLSNVRPQEQRCLTVADGTIVRYVNWHPGSNYELRLDSYLATLDQALTIYKAGGSAYEIYAPLDSALGRHLMPYLVFRKAKVYEEAPFYLGTASYCSYLTEVFTLIEEGIDCSLVPISYPQI